MKVTEKHRLKWRGQIFNISSVTPVFRNPAGDLCERIMIQKRTTTTGTRGQSTDKWCDLQGRYAKVEFLRGKELEQARQIVSTASARVTIRDDEYYDSELICGRFND